MCLKFESPKINPASTVLGPLKWVFWKNVKKEPIFDHFTIPGVFIFGVFPLEGGGCLVLGLQIGRGDLFGGGAYFGGCFSGGLIGVGTDSCVYKIHLQ